MDDSKTFIEDINPGNSLTGVRVRRSEERHDV